MKMVKCFIVFFVLLCQFAYGAQALLSQSSQRQIASEISAKGSSRVIVGIGGAKSSGLSVSALQATKTGFLHSSSVLHAQIDQSMKVVDKLEHFPFVVLDIKSAGLKTLISHPQVSSIEPDRKLKAFLKTAVPKVVGVSNPWGKSTYNGQGSWVAVLDSGVNTSHPMFQGKSIVQACFTTDSSCPNGANTQYGSNSADPLGKSDHGTHVAGIAVGNYIPSKGFGGIAHKAGLIAIQVFNRDDAAYTSSLVRALNYVYSQAASKRVAAVNLSLGSDFRYSIFDDECEVFAPSITSAIKKLRSRKVASVIASGNHGSTFQISFPSCITEAIAVASARKDYRVSNFSNRSAQVSLIAPGSSIQSASYGANYVTYSGTSMAAPMIAGSFAVLRKEDPSASVSAIEAALQSASRSIVESFPFNETNGHYWPLLNKARTNIGGTTQQTTAVGFNTASSLNRFNEMVPIPWNIDTSNASGVNGVIYADGFTARSTALMYPQSIFNGRVSARMKSDGTNYYGLIIRQGGTNNEDNFNDAYLLQLLGTSYYVVKYEHGKSETIIASNFPPPAIVNFRDWNTLMATTGGKTVKFYINGHFIGQHSSDRLIYGAPGFFKGGNTRTYVDWFVTKSNTVNSGYR